MENFLTEAFKELRLTEEAFDLTADAEKLDKLQEFVADDIEEEEVEPIIDIEAATENDLADNYQGKVIMECTCCHSRIYKDANDIELDDESGLANIEEICPVCKNDFGYIVIGKIGKLDDKKAEEEKVEDEVKDEVEIADDEAETIDSFPKDDVDVEESCKLSEDLTVNVDDDQVDILAGNKEVKISNIDMPADDIEVEEENEEADDEFIVPLTDEEKEDIINGEEENLENTDEENIEIKDETEEAEDAGEEVEETEGVGEDETVDEMLEQDVVKEDYKESEFGKKAWMLGQIMQAMNDEEAYYGGWLYSWPDGETEIDCMDDFNDEDDYIELEKSFIKYYKRYHDSGLYNAPEAVEKAAHDWDIKLGLDPIENIKDIHEEVETKEESTDESLTEGIGDTKYKDDTDEFFKAIEASYEEQFGEKLPETVYFDDDQLVLDIPDEDLVQDTGALEDAFEEADIFYPCFDDEYGRYEMLEEAPAKIWAKLAHKILKNKEKIVNKFLKAQNDRINKSLNEFDDVSYNNLVEGFLRLVYSNVNTFETEDVRELPEALEIEGSIKYKNGTAKKSTFVFESNRVNKFGKLVLEGYNKSFSPDKNTFKVRASINEDKLIPETFIYNYKVNHLNESNQSEDLVVKGRIDK